MASNIPNANDGNQKKLENVLNNYLSIWNGDVSRVNSTFAPVLSFHGDRFPTSNGSRLIEIGTADEFGAFVKSSRTGWDKYEFKVHAWTGYENQIAVRWKLEAVVGANFTIVPTTLKQGTPVTYNGTDFLILDQCTGLIKEINIAQDLISFFHNLGLTGVTV
ncbi:hypothetical protein BGW36DRAFT_423159 [Talaromyces proteolyticus]|uniref:SnoaL-like domain-containing protein n=1 Tax=Talaromyces proteolyticus TaxID=1131652 RepID=A0AAD4KZR8_9EURO|nr:uncharacterized protein BGW36DRAFT_423159 [Talaromyces proteolyticus]KAH8703604.1 hypothetical protein BGW36DRAFT_423159 [Talaromyces proteolyticus]